MANPEKARENAKKVRKPELRKVAQQVTDVLKSETPPVPDLTRVRPPAFKRKPIEKTQARTA